MAYLASMHLGLHESVLCFETQLSPIRLHVHQVLHTCYWSSRHKGQNLLLSILCECVRLYVSAVPKPAFGQHTQNYGLVVRYVRDIHVLYM